jgi:uncharacterized integral membrane protein
MVSRYRKHLASFPRGVGCGPGGEEYCMSDDAGRGRVPGAPYGGAGPLDPTADPVTDPRLSPVPAVEGRTEPVPASKVRTSRTGVLWVGSILSALVLLFLLVFILQNGDPVNISVFTFNGTLPTGVALLLAAIAGILLVAIPGSLRILQLRRAARRGPPGKG